MFLNIVKKFNTFIFFFNFFKNIIFLKISHYSYYYYYGLKVTIIESAKKNE